jgi:membrane protein YdbS with pleckstrin-like domain
MGASRAGLPLRPPAHRVDPAARWLWAAQGGLVTVVVAAVVLVLSFAVPEDDVPHWFSVVLAVARWLLIPLALVSMVIEPLWRFRVHRWEVTADAVYTLEGWLTRTWRIVPISRIQTVDTTRGPLQQLLGLTSISVRTASHAGSTSIEQLPAPKAAAVAHDLGLRANAIRDEAT